MTISSSNWNAEAYVTAANPPPGRIELQSYLVPSGTGFEERFITQTDGGIGLNVYIAGGTGPSGVLPVSQTNPTQISLSGVSLSGVIEVTTSAGHPVAVTGAVYVVNPLTASISGVVGVSQSNVPVTQTVYVAQQPIGVTGVVGLSGTASVFVEGLGGPVEVTGVVAVSQSNLPATQSVYVVNQTSGNVTVSGTASVSVTNFPAVVTVSGTGAFDVTVSNLPAVQTVQISGVAPVSGYLPVTGSISVSSSARVAPTSSSNSQVSFPTASLQVLGLNTNRTSFSIFNDGTARILIRFGAVASLSGFDTKLPMGAYYEPPYPTWCGEVSIIGETSGTGFIYIGEQAL